MGVRGTRDIIDSIEKKRLQWYGHVKRMLAERIPKLIMEWIPLERRKRGRPRKIWMEGGKAAMVRWCGCSHTTEPTTTMYFN
jgi:hypothetical protein